VPYCTKCHNVVGAHDTKGDVDPELGEFVLILFPFEDGYLPAATLRPETVYGVTNMWINPEATYVKAKVDGRILYMSKEAALKMELQDYRVETLEEFKGDRIIGKACRHPLEDKEIPILKGLFVDPANATGVVMSVPSHAPYDYAALRDEWGGRADEALVDVIEVEGGPHPAKRIVEEMGIKDQNDPKLEEATKTLYRRELRHGRMITGEFKGLPVEEARERVKEKLLSMDKGLLMHEILNRPVKCRCGGAVEVKIVEDQWFIDYSNPEWKEKARECLRNMRIIPENRRKDYEYAIEWLHEKACTRASGLGTRFPFDETKMIEALSDSTVYMAFYTVRHKLKRPLSVEEWDYVLLGKGEGKDELKELREHFDYWYPLDSRHSGADLIYNHLPFFIFNHSAIFPREKWPKQIVTNGFVLMNGQKMSKSLGNIRRLRNA